MKDEDIIEGAVLRYVGESHGMKGSIVKVICRIREEKGVPSWYEVQPWIAKDGRYSFVLCDATAAELEPAPDAPPVALERNDPIDLLLTPQQEPDGE